MPILPRSTISLAIEGDALVGVAVRESAAGASSRELGAVPDFLAASQSERARLASDAGDGILILTIPASWCAVRPIAVTRRQWKSARPELLRNVEGFFPLPADDAMVGLVDRVDESRAPASRGYLIAASRRRVEPWLEAISRAFGRRPSVILAPHMALAGLGLQQHESARVLERLPTGACVEHVLRWGAVVELARSAAAPAFESPTSLAVVHGHAADAAPGAIAPVSSAQLAIASALAMSVASSSLAPLSGTAPRTAPTWIPAAALAALAVAMVIAGTRVSSWRESRALAQVEARRSEQAEALARVVADRDRAQQLAALIRAAEALGPASSPDLLADLQAAQEALPADGFLYRVELDAKALAIRGEAKRAGDVLRAIEESPRFHAAREMDTAAAIEERRLESFHIRAERSDSAPVTSPTAQVRP